MMNEQKKAPAATEAKRLVIEQWQYTPYQIDALELGYKPRTVNLEKVRETVPHDLQQVAQFIVWQYQPNPGKDKPKKIPLRHNGVGFTNGSSTDKATCMSFEQALALYDEHSELDGIGFALFDDDGLTVVDLDDCYNGDQIAPWAQAYIDDLQSWTELTPSGKGFHVVVKADVPGMKTKSQKFHDAKLEMYKHGRYFTITGVVLPEHRQYDDVEDGQQLIEELNAELLASKQAAPAKAAAGTAVVSTRCASEVLSIIGRVANGNGKGRATADKFLQLHNGGFISEDQSSDDMAYFNIAAFYSGKDPEVMHQLYFDSAIVRDKSNRDDYVQRTIDEAIAKCTTTFESSAVRHFDDLTEQASYTDLQAEVKEMDEDADLKHVEDIARRSTGLSDIERDSVFKAIKDKLGINVTALRGIAKQAKVETQKRKVMAKRDQFAGYEPLERDWFPDVSFNEETGATRVLATIPNVRKMLKHYGIEVFYDVVKKKHFINVPGQHGSPDNADNTALTTCISLARLNEIAADQVPAYIHAIGDENQRNPVADWITSTPWDGVDRLQDLCDTLQVKAGYPVTLRNTLVKRWLISAVAAALKPIAFKARGVLTLQGAQSIGKTSWLESLVPDDALRKHLVKTDHLLDPNNKDSVTGAISHWLVELGELDSTFKKDVARLKGFITADMDKVRRPYDRLEAEYQRRTVFFASVNDSNFLVDDTGNTRFWTLAVDRINYTHRIDMQQLWAQVVTLYENGEQWWLTREEEAQLEELNRGHRVTTAVRDLIMSQLDWDCVRPQAFTKQSATQVLRTIGFDKPTNAQAKEAGAVLREMVGEPTKTKGSNVWKVPPTKVHTFFDEAS